MVIPGFKNPDHIRDNFDMFDFSLTDEDMAEIAKVDKGVRYYTATSEMIAAYASMELKEDRQRCSLILLWNRAAPPMFTRHYKIFMRFPMKPLDR